MQPTRRVFLQGSLAAAVGPVAVPAMAKTAASANDRIRVAIVGAGDRSRFHVEALNRLTAENVKIAAICDCDETVLHARFAGYEQLTGRKVRTETDQRRLFDDPSIDAISFATPDHWHALQTIWLSRQARTFISRSRALTTCSRAASSSRRQGSTSGSSSTAPSFAPVRRSARGSEDQGRDHRRCVHGAGNLESFAARWASISPDRCRPG